jgi:hypothetical protein
MTNDDHFENGHAGWQPLLRELDTALKERWPNYQILQVKEKFGTLRFYAKPGVELPDFPDSDEGVATHNEWYNNNVYPFYDLIHQYEDKSASICELCGQPGNVGDNGYWWATRCDSCAPDGWVAGGVRCDHPSITDNRCDTCGRQRLAHLEHTNQVLSNVHPADACAGERCTIHNRTDHTMRTFPQHWRNDRKMMERICPHGIGHPDPDDHKLDGPGGAVEAVHGCDGCCTGGAL